MSEKDSKLNIINEIKKLPVLFWLTGFFTLILVLVGVIQGAEFAISIEKINQYTFKYFGNYYLWFALLCFILFVSLGLSPLGKIKFGGQDAKASHSFFSWFAMIFCAGMGVGLLFWGSAEPLYHFINPPFLGSESIVQRKIDAMHISFFHWGLSPWAIYGLTALAVGFYGMNLKKGFFFTAILEKNEALAPFKKFIKPIIDFITILAIMFGVSASFAIAVLQLSGGLENVFNINAGVLSQLTIIILITIAFMISSMRGLNKGIKFLSNLSIIISLLLMFGIAIWGPKYNVGEMLGMIPSFAVKFPALSLGMMEYNDAHWLSDWTLPYWAWWIAFAPFVGIFVAMISKGRTIRQLVLASLLGPGVLSLIWFIIFGGAALSLQIQSNYFGSDIDLNNVNTVLFSLLDTITKSPILHILTILLIATFFINSADSASYTLASLSNDDMENQPPKILQLGWGLMLSFLASLFLFTGGLQTLLKVTLVTVLPFSLWLVIVFIFMIIELVKYYKREILHEPEKHKEQKPKGKLTPNIVLKDSK